MTGKTRENREVDHLTVAQRRKAAEAAKTVQRIINGRLGLDVATCSAPFKFTKADQKGLEEGLKFHIALRLETPEDCEMCADVRSEPEASIGYQLRSHALRLLRAAEDLCDLART